MGYCTWKMYTWSAREGTTYVRGGLYDIHVRVLTVSALYLAVEKSLKYTTILNTFCRQLIYMNCTS